MKFGDEFIVNIPLGFDPDHASIVRLNQLFQNGKRVTRFKSAANNSFIQDLTDVSSNRSLWYKVDEDSLIEINDAFLRTPIIVRNQVSDLISFQFALSVKRSEFLGEQKNLHNLGPAIIVTVVPQDETTHRVPRVGVHLRHVMVHTTLSSLIQRMGESTDHYPKWLLSALDGTHNKPRQRVLFLEETHRDLIKSCFNIPVSGGLLGHWMAAKFNELLCIGLQILKKNQPAIHGL